MIAAGIDPVEKQKAAKIGRVTALATPDDTFEQVARGRHESRAESGWSPSYAKETLEYLERNVFPIVRHRPMREITRADIKECLLRERPGRASKMTKPPLGEAHKLRQTMDSAFQYELHKMASSSAPLFPGQRSPNQPISDNTINAALRALCYLGDLITGDDFRGMALTPLNEQGWNSDAIERQQAHGERDKVRAASDHARKMPERRKMMQAWTDYVDELRKDMSGNASGGVAETDLDARKSL